MLLKGNFIANDPSGYTGVVRFRLPTTNRDQNRSADITNYFN